MRRALIECERQDDGSGLNFVRVTIALFYTLSIRGKSANRTAVRSPLPTRAFTTQSSVQIPQFTDVAARADELGGGLGR
jgi:hypothetical protein